MSWETGSERIQELINAGELGQVSPDTELARRMLVDARRHLVIAQFGSSIRALRSFSRLRRARNSFEYPSTETPGPSGDDVKDAIRVAREVNDAADKILKSEVLSPW